MATSALAKLALEDGTVYTGISFGADGEAVAGVFDVAPRHVDVPVFELERGNFFQIKDAAIRLISRDKFHGRHNWKVVMVKFSGRGALVTRSEYEAAVKVN